MDDAFFDAWDVMQWNGFGTSFPLYDYVREGDERQNRSGMRRWNKWGLGLGLIKEGGAEGEDSAVKEEVRVGGGGSSEVGIAHERGEVL